MPVWYKLLVKLQLIAFRKLRHYKKNRFAFMPDAQTES